MKSAIDRIVQTYGLLTNRDDAAAAKERVENYIRTLVEGGETDIDRLTVCGLVYLREQDGSNVSVKAGYTGM